MDIIIYSLLIIFMLCCVFTTINGTKLKKSVNTDSLTGMFNRKILPKIETNELNQKKYFVIACDIDHFKRVNDTFGHSAGDLVIKSISEILRGSFKANLDFVVRFGGEEFFIFVLSNEMKNEDVLIRVESIRKKIEDMTLLTKDMSVIRVTSSFGICFNKDLPLKEKIESADASLYEAKESGRNRVIYK
jgi:diguanylate cyclase (GGDEF)-like protein